MSWLLILALAWTPGALAQEDSGAETPEQTGSSAIQASRKPFDGRLKPLNLNGQPSEEHEAPPVDPDALPSTENQNTDANFGNDGVPNYGANGNGAESNGSPAQTTIGQGLGGVKGLAGGGALANVAGLKASGADASKGAGEDAAKALDQTLEALGKAAENPSVSPAEIDALKNEFNAKLDDKTLRHTKIAATARLQYDTINERAADGGRSQPEPLWRSRGQDSESREDFEQRKAATDDVERSAETQTGENRRAAYRAAGKSRLATDQPDLAERDFRKALQQDPGDQRSRAGLALALAQQGRPDEAKVEAQKVLAQNPKNEDAKMVLGQAESLGQSQGVVKKVSKLVTGLWSGPAAEKVADGQAQAQATVGAHSLPEAAGPVLLQARAPASRPAEPSVAMTPMLPPPSMAHYKEAFGKLQVRDMTGALFEATASINDAPNSAAPWVLRAYIDNRLTPEPNPKGAVSDAGQALHIEPQNAAALREKALGEITQGQLQPALSDLAAAISLDPKNGTGYLYRAMAREKLGRASDAVADYSQAASLDPALTPFANDALARLGGAKFAERADGSAASLRNRRLLRGGMIALALALILAGMLSTETGRKLVTQRAVFTTKGASFERTVGPSRALPAGEVIGGNYRIVRELGRGGMGIVYEALDLALQRKVAVKQLQRTETATAEDLERFLREARLVAKLRNPRLVEIYNVINEGDLFLVFEYMDGKSLDHVLGSRRKLSLSEVHQALADVGAAVDYAHGQNVIHRDLKPANVMVERDGRCKVMDFGIAHQSQAATFMTQTVASGTPPYMAPEQAFGSVSKASDLYAMGVMAYEMATGRRPFAGPDYVEQKLQRRFDSVAAQQLPPSLDAFFQKALDPDPTKRYSSAAELLQGFRAACATQPV